MGTAVWKIVKLTDNGKKYNIVCRRNMERGVES